MKRTVSANMMHLTRVSLFKSSIDIGPDVIDNNPEIEGYSFSFAQKTDSNLDEKLVRIRINVLLEGKDIEQAPIDVRAEFGVEFVFTIDNMNEFCTQEKKASSISIDPILATALIGIAYSTARGIIFQETKGSYISGVILPIIAPMELLNINEPSTDNQLSKE